VVAMLDPRHKEGGLATTTRPPQAVPPASSTTESLARLPVGSSTRPVALMGPVKPGAGQDQAGFPAGQAGSGAPSHHEPTVKHGAVKPGRVSLPGPHPEQQTLADLRRRVVTPLGSNPLGVSARDRRSRGRCGWTNFLQDTRRPADGKAVWYKCQARGCPDCGPEIRERNLAHDLANMANRQMIRRVVARSAWRAVLAKIKRAEGLRVVYPQPDGMLAVYATAGLTGTVVMDAPQQLADDYERIP
jgi:hypothetical protein